MATKRPGAAGEWRDAATVLAAGLRDSEREVARLAATVEMLEVELSRVYEAMHDLESELERLGFEIVLRDDKSVDT